MSFGTVGPEPPLENSSLWEEPSQMSEMSSFSLSGNEIRYYGIPLSHRPSQLGHCHCLYSQTLGKG